MSDNKELGKQRRSERKSGSGPMNYAAPNDASPDDALEDQDTHMSDNIGSTSNARDLWENGLEDARSQAFEELKTTFPYQSASSAGQFEMKDAILLATGIKYLDKNQIPGVDILTYRRTPKAAVVATPSNSARQSLKVLNPIGPATNVKAMVGEPLRKYKKARNCWVWRQLQKVESDKFTDWELAKKERAFHVKYDKDRHKYELRPALKKADYENIIPTAEDDGGTEENSEDGTEDNGEEETEETGEDDDMVDADTNTESGS